MTREEAIEKAGLAVAEALRDLAINPPAESAPVVAIERPKRRRRSLADQPAA